MCNLVRNAPYHYTTPTNGGGGGAGGHMTFKSTFHNYGTCLHILTLIHQLYLYVVNSSASCDLGQILCNVLCT